ncbi:flagellar assembly protein [Photobacterium sp. SKA34]|nr:flagellar assembly protein [Photobacterium sp. SKA34]
MVLTNWVDLLKTSWLIELSSLGNHSVQLQAAVRTV